MITIKFMTLLLALYIIFLYFLLTITQTEFVQSYEFLTSLLNKIINNYDTFFSLENLFCETTPFLVLTVIINVFLLFFLIKKKYNMKKDLVVFFLYGSSVTGTIINILGLQKNIDLNKSNKALMELVKLLEKEQVQLKSQLIPKNELENYWDVFLNKYALFGISCVMIVLLISYFRGTFPGDEFIFSKEQEILNNQLATIKSYEGMNKIFSENDNLLLNLDKSTRDSFIDSKVEQWAARLVGETPIEVNAEIINSINDVI